MNTRDVLSRGRARVKQTAAHALTSPQRLAQVVHHRPGPGATEIRARLDVLARALDLPAGTPSQQVRALLEVLADPDPGHLWLTLSVLNAALPVPDDVVRLRRRIILDGAVAALSPLLAPVSRLGAPPHPDRQVRVTGRVVVDVEHTSRTALATGIQRVTRQTVGQWYGSRDLELVAWTADHTALHILPAHQARLAATGDGTRADDDPAEPGRPQIVVPWHGTYVVTEVIDGVDRNRRLMALARYAPVTVGALVHDLVPMNNAETCSPGVPEWFPWYLAFLRYADRLATNSRATAAEYEGWRTMLGAIGVPGPRLRPVPLGISVPAEEDIDVEGAAEQFLIGNLPMFLMVNSVEPRKNHLAVLHAAETAWRRGYRFSLTMIGGNGWANTAFHERLAELREAGRPVEFRTGIDDDLLWGAYRNAYACLNPSLQEGYGLTAAESLSVGTPVILSGFGSLAEIAEGGGCLRVDPRDDHSITEAMCRLLDDRNLRDELAEQARGRRYETWEHFADTLWRFLVDGEADH